MTATKNNNNVYVFGKKKSGMEFKLSPGALTIKEALKMVAECKKD